MPSAAKKSLRMQPFHDSYTTRYALRVSRRSIVDGVREVECRMCRAFGHEEDDDAAVGSKRKLQPDVKSWAGPLFRTDYFLRHLKSQHEVHWAIYQTLESEEEKDEYLRVGDDDDEKVEEQEEQDEEKPSIKEEEKVEEENFGQEDDNPSFKEVEEAESPFKEEENAAGFDETDAGQETFAAALAREIRTGREKLLTTVSEIMVNQRKSVEALQAMVAGMQADYVSLRQRELEMRERELKCVEAERRERQEDRKVSHEQFLALLNAKQTD